MRASLVIGPNPHAIDGAYGVKAWLEAQGVTVETVETTGYADGNPHDPDFLADCERVRSSELVIVFGGDGTTLRAARLVGHTEIPILSFNFGHLGFLSSDSNAAMIDRLTTVLAHEIEPVRHSTLDIHVACADGHEVTCFALNEAVISRGERGHLVGFTVDINGQRIARMRGDGIMVSTATGSTAYALSVGGPIVAPDYRGIMVVPIACHTLQSRTIMTGAADVVEIELSDELSEDPVTFIDGQVLPEVPTGMRASRGEGDVLLYRFEKDAFYRTVSASFFGGDGDA